MATDFEQAILDATGRPLRCREIATLQVNLTLRCNQQCAHCHLAAGPDREEHMDAETADLVLEALDRLDAPTVDITGGAPELNENLPTLIEGAQQRGCPVMVRTNLTALRGRPGLAGFFAAHGVRLVASLPCYMRENVEDQRGEGVYEESIETIRGLNGLGYGRQRGLELDLVYNPAGPFLPPAQGELERDYRRELRERFDLHFTRLLTITNMPIGRFAQLLHSREQMGDYLRTLRDSFNPETIPSLMCRHQVTVGPDGTLYDCDFNLALDLPLRGETTAHVSELDPDRLVGRRIATGAHCFACTAGAGSSCRGALAED